MCRCVNARILNAAGSRHSILRDRPGHGFDRFSTPPRLSIVRTDPCMNEATFEEVQRLPSIGPKLAERIMANRPFHTVEDLLKVGGVGTKTLERLRPLVRVEGVEGEK